MSDSLGVQEDGIVQLLVGPGIRFSTMEVGLEFPAFSLCFGFSLVDLWQESVDWRSEVFLIYHVKSNDHF
jgi:hypothetical protein